MAADGGVLTGGAARHGPSAGHGIGDRGLTAVDPVPGHRVPSPRPHRSDEPANHEIRSSGSKSSRIVRQIQTAHQCRVHRCAWDLHAARMIPSLTSSDMGGVCIVKAMTFCVVAVLGKWRIGMTACLLSWANSAIDQFLALAWPRNIRTTGNTA